MDLLVILELKVGPLIQVLKYKTDSVCLRKRNKYTKQAQSLKKKHNIITLPKGKSQDHPPITPMHLTSKYRKLKKDSPESNLYNYIVDYFFATLDKDCTLQNVISRFKVGNQSFVAKYTKTFDEGFIKYLPFDEADIN